MDGIAWTNTTKTQNQHCTKRPNDQGESSRQPLLQSNRIDYATAYSYSSEPLPPMNIVCMCLCVREKSRRRCHRFIAVVCLARASFSFARFLFGLPFRIHRSSHSTIISWPANGADAFLLLLSGDDVRLSMFRW